MWIYIGRLILGEKEFIEFLLENNGASKDALDNNFSYAKSGIKRFIVYL